MGTVLCDHVRNCLKAGTSREGGCESLSELCRRVGVSRATMYRWLRRIPWGPSGGKRSADNVLGRTALVLRDVKDHLLWLAGYNPFIAKGLTLRELHLLYEIVLKLVAAVKGGHFDGNLRGIAGLAADELARMSKQRKGAVH